MKSILIISVLLVLGLNGFGQSNNEIVGTWIKDSYKKKAMEFTIEGEIILFEVGIEQNITDRDKFQYKTIQEGNSKYLIMFKSMNGKEIQLSKDKYKIEGNKLYLPISSTTKGVTTVRDFVDIYSRKETK